jgi:hypothetical protein
MSEAVATTVPLMILISLGICSLAREYELANLVGSEPWYSFDKIPIVDAPRLGPFSAIHGLNFLIVSISLTISVSGIPLENLSFSGLVSNTDSSLLYRSTWFHFRY